MCSRTHKVALDWLFDRINLDPKIQIKYIDTKIQLADISNQRKFHTWRMESSVVFAHFSSTVCSEAMAKIVQQDSGDERVTAKSRPMMSLIARAPSNPSSSASESPGTKSYESQSPWSAKAVKDDRPGQPVVGSDLRTAPGYYHEQFTESSFSARNSKWDDNKDWSSQEWKADTSMCDRSGQPVVIFQRGARPQQFILRTDETESELSVESRSFLSRVNDQVRKRQKRSSMNVTEDGEKHSMIWRMFMSATSESAVLMGKN